IQPDHRVLGAAECTVCFLQAAASLSDRYEEIGAPTHRSIEVRDCPAPDLTKMFEDRKQVTLSVRILNPGDPRHDEASSLSPARCGGEAKAGLLPHSRYYCHTGPERREPWPHRPDRLSGGSAGA